MKLSVFHDGRFWVGVVEEQDDTGLKAARQIFGSEPKDTEILEFVNHRMMALLERTACHDSGCFSQRRAKNQSQAVAAPSGPGNETTRTIHQGTGSAPPRVGKPEAGKKDFGTRAQKRTGRMETKTGDPEKKNETSRQMTKGALGARSLLTNPCSAVAFPANDSSGSVEPGKATGDSETAVCQLPPALVGRLFYAFR
jgi:hypothetical protein